jgi:hypothetical protein
VLQRRLGTRQKQSTQSKEELDTTEFSVTHR